MQRARLWLARVLGVPLVLVAWSVPVLIGALLAALFGLIVPHEKRDPACLDAEWIIHQAARCAYFPNMWKRWSDIDALYGTKPSTARGANAENCPGLIADSSQFGLEPMDLYEIGGWMTQRESNVLHYWREVRGEEFCAFVRRRIT